MHAEKHKSHLVIYHIQTLNLAALKTTEDD